VPFPLDSLPKLTYLDVPFPRTFAVFGKHDVVNAFEGLSNCSRTHPCNEVAIDASRNLARSKCDYGAASARDKYQTFRASLAAAAATVSAWFASLKRNHLPALIWSPPRPSELDRWRARVTLPMTEDALRSLELARWRAREEWNLSPAERRANLQYDDALSLTRSPKPDYPQSDIDIERALIVHLSNVPQDTDLKSLRVTQLCALLAHHLGFVLAADYAKSIHLDTHPHTLIQHDESFALLHALLAPDWGRDEEGAPTFSVHPVDVQLFDPEETTSDLLAPYGTIDDSASPDSSAARAREIRESRERLTDKAALERVRSHVVTSIAESVRHEGDRTSLDWRVRAKFELIIAACSGMTYGDVLGRLGDAAMRDISVRGNWRWPDDPPDDEYGPAPASMPEHVAKWLVRVLASAPVLPDMTDTQASPRATGLMAFARMDTPASLVVGSPEWNDLVKGVEIIGERHWYASFATVCHAGRTGEVPRSDAPGSDDGNPPDQPGTWRKKPPRSSKSRHRRTQR